MGDTEETEIYNLNLFTTQVKRKAVLLTEKVTHVRKENEAGAFKKSSSSKIGKGGFQTTCLQRMQGDGAERRTPFDAH